MHAYVFIELHIANFKTLKWQFAEFFETLKWQFESSLEKLKSIPLGTALDIDLVFVKGLTSKVESSKECRLFTLNFDVRSDRQAMRPLCELTF